MTSIVFQCAAIHGVNKSQDLKVDANGYRWVILGALNAFNAAGWYYSFEHAKALFENSAELMRRVENKRLRGENGHPRFQPGMTQMQWFSRVNDLYEPNLCAHYSKISLSFDGHKDEQGNNIILIMGLTKESGEKGGFLEKQFQNPEEDICFSIRSFTEDNIIAGRKTKMLKKIVTWDVVNEPGMSPASKSNSMLQGVTPAMESLGLSMDKTADLEMCFFTDTLRNEIITESNSVSLGLGMESAHSALLTLVAEIEKPIKIFVPAAMKW